MKSYLVAILFLVILGCQSGLRTSPERSALGDERLKGSWQVVSDDGKPDWNEAPIVISQFSNTEYVAGPLALGDVALSLEDATKVHILTVDKFRFLHIQSLQNRKAWSVARLEMGGDDTFRLHFLKEDVFRSKDLSPSKLKAVLRQHAENRDSYVRYGAVSFQKISDDRSVQPASVDMFNVEFGILFPRTFGVRERTTTIPFDLCDSFRFGFYIRPPDGRSYEVRTVHHLPAIPLAAEGIAAKFEASHALKLHSGTRTARGPRRVAYGFSAGDPLGAYRMELFINGALHTEIGYTVVEPESARECESVGDWE